MFTKKEVQNYLKIGDTKMYQLLQDGEIKAYKYNNEYRFLMEDVNKYLLSVGLPCVSLPVTAKSDMVGCSDLINSTLTKEDSKICDASPYTKKDGEDNMKKGRTYAKRGNPFRRDGKNGTTWTVMFYVTDAAGKKKQRYKGGFKTKAAAQEYLNTANGQVMNHTYIASNNILLKDYLVHWHYQNYKKYLEYPLEHRKVSANTIEEYERVIAKQVIPEIGTLKLKDISKETIESLYDRLLMEKKYSANAIWRINKVLNKAFRDAIEEDVPLLAKNPCQKVRLPEEAEYEPRIFTEQELKKLVQALQGTSIELPALISFALGLRRGEAIGTDIKDWDFKNKTVYLHQQITKINPDAKGERAMYGILPHLKTRGKKKLKNRHLSVPPYLMEKVKERIKQVNADKKNNPNYKDLGLLCCRADGDFLSPKWVYQQYKNLLDKCGLDANRFHDLRGSSITLLYDNNVPLANISKNVGHENEKITREKYCKSKKVDTICADTMQKILFDRV